MAELFLSQGKEYSAGRPSYPPKLFRFIANKAPGTTLAWDVGTGSGQAAAGLAAFFTDVIATDASEHQLSFAPSLPNVRYAATPPSPTADNLLRLAGVAAGTVDAIAVAQALHWFDLPSFYALARHVARPGGVVAAWCYTLPAFGAAAPRVDAVLRRVYDVAWGFWSPERRLVEEEYRTIEFPFEAAEGEEHTGPFEFEIEREMDMESFITYIRSWSSYQAAKRQGVELLDGGVLAEIEEGWLEGGGDGGGSPAVKLAKYPVFLRIGRVSTP